jgi:hypothetical protein
MVSAVGASADSERLSLLGFCPAAVATIVDRPSAAVEDLTSLA